QAARAFKKFMPLFDRVLVQRFEAEVKSKGGIMLPEKAKGKVLEATVVAHGPGFKNDVQKGEIVPVCVTVGDKVFLPEYGGTKVVLDEQEYFLFREADILAKFE
ncbi:chaperonin GroES, partial [Clonorchis sinensis]